MNMINKIYKIRILIFFILFLIILNFVSASQLKVTQEHPFLINNKWVEAKQLQPGDLLTTIDNKKARITSIEQVVQQVEVYNIEDNWFHNYAADNIVVHNSGKLADSDIKLPNRVNIPYTKSNEIIPLLKKGNSVMRYPKTSFGAGEPISSNFFVIKGERFSTGIGEIQGCDTGQGVAHMLDFLNEAKVMAKSMGYNEMDVYAFEIKNLRLMRLLELKGFKPAPNSAVEWFGITSMPDYINYVKTFPTK